MKSEYSFEDKLKDKPAEVEHSTTKEEGKSTSSDAMTGPYALAGVSSIIVHDEEEPSNFESITKMELSLLCDNGISDPTEILRKRSREAAAKHGLPIGPIPPR